ncbi:replication protein [Lentibacillus salicampi]|uniref:Replication protein n=1 Tax=Lentibacillus salicampi TaxID=175306 RepID=A0A4Y9AAF7_9BACI|nr:replication protein [Lentibacillus salicampi]TFJ92167.1 replication protein [Lentibacillus salicampi]
MKASHKKREQIIGNQMIELEEGQFITGRQSLSNDLNRGVKPKLQQSEITWWRYLNNLEKWGMLNIKRTTKYSIISIIKWSDYQESEQQMNNKRTTDEQQMNTNKNVENVENVENVKKYSRKYIYDDTHLSMAESFYNKILENNPNNKKPNFEKWANEIRLMMERDGRNEEQITYLMNWVQQDDFEMSNVMSPDKLRKRFDQLIMKVKKQKSKTPSKEDFDLT